MIELEKTYLAHYGVKGQKWGVRRYQNADGSLTKEGKARAKAEYKQDNKEAFEKGRVATVYANASKYAKESVLVAQKRYDKNPTDRNKCWLDADKRVNKKLDKYKKQTLNETTKHYNKLVNKYGKEAVSSIKYDKNGDIKERMVSSKERIRNIGVSLGTGGTILMRNKSAKEAGREVYTMLLGSTVKEMKEKGQWYK